MLRPVYLLFILGLWQAGDAFGNPASLVPGGQDPDNPNVDEAQKSVDVFGEVDYSYELDSSTVVRERLGPGADPDAPLPTVQDLKYKQFKHTITPRLQVGIYHDTFLYAALPIVITQVRELSLVDPTNRATPKSSSLTAPFGNSQMLAGFTSRCTTPCSCAYSSPSHS